MNILRRFILCKCGIAATMVAMHGAVVFAQDTVEDSAVEETAETNEPVEEIVVVAPKPGSRRRVDDEYEDPVRAQLLKDFYKMKEDDEEFAWRASKAEENSSRIEWGYDPAAEYKIRNDLDLQALPSEQVKPATIFRVQF